MTFSASYSAIYIHGLEKNSAFPFPKSCPIILERDRKAVLVRTVGKEMGRKGVSG